VKTRLALVPTCFELFGGETVAAAFAGHDSPKTGKPSQGLGKCNSKDEAVRPILVAWLVREARLRSLIYPGASSASSCRKQEQTEDFMLWPRIARAPTYSSRSEGQPIVRGVDKPFDCFRL
jgi:hypothetical protein